MAEKIPAIMRFVHVATPGGPNAMSIAAMPVPEPKAGELLIRVLAAGINRPHVQQRPGLYPPPADASLRLRPRLETGKYRPIIHQVFPLEAVSLANAPLESSTHIGKIMLRVA